MFNKDIPEAEAEIELRNLDVHYDRPDTDTEKKKTSRKGKSKSAKNTEDEVENVFGAGRLIEVPIEIPKFESVAWEKARSLFQQALAELKFYGCNDPLDAFRFQFRDEHGHTVVSVYGDRSGEFTLSLDHDDPKRNGVRFTPIRQHQQQGTTK